MLQEVTFFNLKMPHPSLENLLINSFHFVVVIFQSSFFFKCSFCCYWCPVLLLFYSFFHIFQETSQIRHFCAGYVRTYFFSGLKKKKKKKFGTMHTRSLRRSVWWLMQLNLLLELQRISWFICVKSSNILNKVTFLVF